MNLLQPLLDWLAAEPGWALAIIAGASFVDAMLLIGFAVPSYVLLLGVGALVALEALPLWPALAATAGGALAGDCFNYWLGGRYLERCARHPRMRRFRDSIDRSRRFFLRRGGLALVAGRLFGPTRPFGPMIAGAAQLPPLRFLLWMGPACLLWAASFILPGVAIGASLQMAAEVATRLLLLLTGGIVLALGLVWGVSLLVPLGALWGERLIHRLLAWSERHRRLGLLPRWLADPAYPETPALLLVATLLLLLGWLGLLMTWGWQRDTPMAIDALVYGQMAGLHTPLGLDIARWVAHLGDLPVVLAVATAVLITLLAVGRRRAAAHVVAALAFGGLIAVVLAWGLRAPPPLAFYGEGAAAPLTPGSYGGANLILFTVVVGLLPVLLGRRQRSHWNLLWYRLSAVLIGLVSSAQLYLGQQWFSVTVGSIAIGLLWLLALGIGYRRHGVQGLAPRRLLPVMLLSYVAALLILWPEPAPTPRERPATPLEMTAWLESGWRQLPRHRGDATGRDQQSLSLQWLANAERRDAALRQAGWQPAVPLRWDTAMRLLAPSTALPQLPLPPQQLGLRSPHATFIRPGDAGDRPADLLVLRLWDSRFRVGSDPVWLGSVSRVRSRTLLRIAHLPYTAQASLDPLPWVTALDGFAARRAAADAPLLLMPEAAAEPPTSDATPAPLPPPSPQPAP